MVIIQGSLCEGLVRKIMSSRSPMLGNLIRPGFKTEKAERGSGGYEHLPGMSEVLGSIPSPAKTELNKLTNDPKDSE